MSTHVIISGGGTGGHIFPAIAIADELKKHRPDLDVSFVGASDRMEMQRVPAAGYPITGLWISGIQRRLTLKNALFPLKLISSLWRAHRIVRKKKPVVVIGTGGFASGPLLYAASRLGIPTVIQEQNSYPGITNKLLSKRASIICVAFEGLERWFPKEKIVLTGNPIRADLLSSVTSKHDARLRFNLDPNKPVLLVTGGSLGAASINRATQDWLQHHCNDVQLIWQTGKQNAAAYANEFRDMPNVWVDAFIDDMNSAYVAADVVVARAGASTLSELCALGKASVLIPSPWVAEDHQRKNAESLAKNQAAVVVDETQLDQFSEKVNALFANENTRNMLAKHAKLLGKPNATAVIVEHIIPYIDR